MRKTNGYAAYNEGNKNYEAHRYVCQLAHGAPNDTGLQAAHICGERLCINPRYLYWATPMQNAVDRDRHGRTIGGGRYRQKIFPKDYAYICSGRKSVLELAKEFGVDPTVISRTKHRKKHNERQRAYYYKTLCARHTSGYENIGKGV